MSKSATTNVDCFLFSRSKNKDLKCISKSATTNVDCFLFSRLKKKDLKRYLEKCYYQCRVSIAISVNLKSLFFHGNV